MITKFISAFLAVVISLSILCLPVVAQDTVFEVQLNSDDGLVNIYYKNSLCSNRQIAITITDVDSDETVYYNQAKSNALGTMFIGDIPLPAGGRYAVVIKPAYSSEQYGKIFSYFSEEEKQQYWDIIAVSGSVEEIEEDFSIISDIFELPDAYFEYIDDFSGLYEKIISQRETAFIEMTTSNKLAFSEFVTKMALFTALEQTINTTDAAMLVGDALSCNPDEGGELYDEWQQCMETEDAHFAVSEFLANKGSIDSFEDIESIIQNALVGYRKNTLLKQIAKLNHISKVSAIITDEYNAKLLGIEKYIPDYKKLKSTSSVDKAIVKEFETSEAFVDAFVKALKKAKKDEDELPTSSNTSSNTSSGKTGGGVSVGGGNIYTNTNTAENVISEVVDTVVFYDIDDVQWAKSDILKLYNMGVINGKSKNEFKPYDDVKREEFVKLIVSLMKLEKNEQSVKFNDVSDNEWYHSYIDIASSCGVVNGIGNGIFGVGLTASRQDIAVMIVNTLSYTGIEITNESSSFLDSDAIAPYAEGAVGFLQRSGILNGDESNNFNPGKNATRAEVAVMLSRICNIYLKGGNVK